jgi:hypothetical protein
MTASIPLGLPADVPIALLPIRLETRYHDGKLLIRIYPDALHVDSHEPDLTAEEIEHGVRYWTEVDAAGVDSGALLAAWQTLADAHGVPRAGWIARTTRDGRPTGTPATQSWQRAPLARLLPTRWRAVAYRYSGWLGPLSVAWEVTGAMIEPDLAVGPNPAAGAPPEQLAEIETVMDAGMRWMVDYAAAERAGMAITVTRNDDPDLAAPIVRLIVYGVDERGDAHSGPARLAQLLDAHYYTDGFGIVAPDTPTNNTDTERAGQLGAAVAVSEEYRLADGTRDPIPAPAADSVAEQLARALGFTSTERELLGRDPDGARRDYQAEMNAAVWPASWGYFLTHSLQGIGLPAIRAGRRHFIDHVRADGSLPTLRIGDQPYGVLQVISLRHWRNREGGDTHDATVALLRKASAAWVEVAWTVTVNSWRFQPREAMDVFFRLLATQPRPVGYVGRSALGPEYVSDLWRFLHLGFDAGWRTALIFLTNEVLTQLGLPRDQRYTGTVFSEEAFPVPGPLVGPDPGAYLAELAALAGANPQALAAVAERGETSLLYRVLRHAGLQEIWQAVLRIRAGDRSYTEPELVDVDPRRTPTMTLWRALAEPAPAEQGGPEQTVGEYLRAAAMDDDNLADLREFQTRVTRLGQADPATLDRLLRGSLDLAAHRIDAWMTSYAHRRLDYLRDASRQPHALSLGCFGWLVNLRPATRDEVPPPDGETGPVYRNADNAGHVLAPSMAHATTAAILHAGYVARGGRADKQEAVAVDLSADRVRLARHLSEGVRAGQPLGALLGYRFERALVEAAVQDPDGLALPALILPFRLLAPFTAQVLTADGFATEVRQSSGAATADVADGLELVRRWHAGELPWGSAPDPIGQPDVTLPMVGTPAYHLCVAALRQAADGLDALADAALAEGVHQLATGNPTRAGAVLDALAKGEAPPPELDVVRTPRSGTVHTHRLAFLSSVDLAADLEVWPIDGHQLRAVIEPLLNGWAGRVLGDPHRVRCHGAWHDAAGTVLATAETTLAELRISPLDLLALAGDDPAGGRFELRQRFIDALRQQRPSSVPDEIMAVPDFGRRSEWTRDTLGVEEILQMAVAVRAALRAARPLRGEDLAAPGEALQVTYALADLHNQVSAVTIALTRNRDLLSAAVQAGDIGGMGGYLASLASAGLAGAFPEVGRGWTDAWREELRAKSTTVLAEVEQRLAAKAALEASFHDAGASDFDRVKHLVALLRAMLGEGFAIAPVFSVTTPTALAELLAHSDALTGGDPLAPATWLDQLARVRPGVARLHAALGYAEATGALAGAELMVAQVPYEPGEHWIALPPSGLPPERRTGLAIHTVRPVSTSPGMTYGGLLFDEWNELIPNEHEVAGLTFHYDAPSACAPQAVLLAVPPEADGEWTPENLRDTIADALDLAMCRAVDLQELNKYGHFLPALHFALNADGATVSTDFTGEPAAPATAPIQGAQP